MRGRGAPASGAIARIPALGRRQDEQHSAHRSPNGVGQNRLLAFRPDRRSILRLAQSSAPAPKADASYGRSGECSFVAAGAARPSTSASARLGPRGAVCLRRWFFEADQGLATATVSVMPTGLPRDARLSAAAPDRPYARLWICLGAADRRTGEGSANTSDADDLDSEFLSWPAVGT